MRKILIPAALAAVLGAMMPAAGAADPVHGLWRTQPDDNGNFGHVQIGPCGAEICGVIRKAFGPDGAERPSENIGKRMIWGMTPRGGGDYRGGKIWAPDRDRTYNSRMALAGDRLEVSGCVLGLCRGQVWRRVR